MNLSIDERLSASWHKVLPKSVPVHPEQMWDLCRVFEELGLAGANTQDVTMAKIGPFMFAGSNEEESAIAGFIDYILPLIVAEYCRDLTIEEAIQRFLLYATKVFCSTLRSNCLIKEPLEWNILIHVKRANRQGRYPLESEVVRTFYNQVDALTNSDKEEQITGAILKLKHSKPLLGDKPIALLANTSEGGLFCWT